MSSDHNDPMRPPLDGSVAQHLERIRAGEAERAERPQSGTGTSTAERYAARILPGVRADEAARVRALQDELRARGTWVPSGDAEAEEELHEEIDEGEGEFDPRDSAERRSARVAWRSASTGGYPII